MVIARALSPASRPAARCSSGVMVMRRMLVGSVGVLAVLSLGLAACSDDDDEATGDVDVTLSDFTIAVEPGSVAAGTVTFEVTNDGPSVHEFVVFKTDLDPAELPTNAEGAVQEDEEFEPVDEIEDIPKGAEPSLELDLEAGSYVLVCNIPGHYRQGMRTGFTVT